MKKFLSVILAMSAVFGSLSAVSAPAAAEETVSLQVTKECKSQAADKIRVGDYTYTVLKDGTLELTDVKSKSAKITVPSKVNGKTVTSVGSWAFSYCGNLTSVTLPASVKTIGSYAFSGCDKLSAVSMAKGVKTIASGAFYGCKALKTLSIPTTVKTIDYSAFRGCAGLTKITIPDSVTSLSNDAFDDCAKLTAINVGTNNKNYTSVDGILFNKKKTEILRFPEGKKGAYTIPNSVEKVGYGVFANCKGLTSVKIPKNTYSVSGFAFSNCTALTTITVDANNAYYSSEGGVLFTKKKTGLLRFPEGKSGKYTIPKTVDEINYSAFDGCSKLTSVTIPSSVKYIDTRAFENCTGLTSITIPAGVSTLSYDAFSGCAKLTAINVNANNKDFSSVSGVVFNKNKTELVIYPAGKKGAYTVPNSVKTIGKYSFYGNNNVTSIKMQSGVTTIAKDAFAFCKGLTSVTIPSTVKTIEDWAFSGNSNLKNVYYTGSKANWNNIKVGKNNEYLKNATIHYNYRAKIANLKAAPTNNSAKLTWSKNASASYYKVFVWKDGKWNKLTQTKNNSVLNYTVKSLAANTSYKFRVSGYDKNGKEFAYSDVTVKTKGKIANLKAAPTNNSVKLTWSKNASASYYKVFVWKDGKWNKLTQTKNNSVLNYTVKSLAANTSYKFRVSAYNKSGTAIAYSDVTSKTKGKIANLKAAPTNNSVKLTWSKNASASYYKVFYWNNGKWNKITQTNNNAKVSCNIINLKSATSYKFRVSGYNKNGKEFAYSDITTRTK